ncbi:MAG: hypothetical protein ACRDIB_05255, partial [Ardenticatenaceae bacterium]
LAPCTAGGKALGESVGGRARLLQGPEDRRIRHLLLRPTNPLFWSFLAYRLRCRTMNLYEITV